MFQNTKIAPKSSNFSSKSQKNAKLGGPGRLRREGESICEEKEADGNKEIEEVKDAFGNTIQVKNDNKSLKEFKAELKRIEKQLKDNKKKPYLSDEEKYDSLLFRKHFSVIHAKSKFQICIESFINFFCLKKTQVGARGSPWWNQGKDGEGLI